MSRSTEASAAATDDAGTCVFCQVVSGAADATIVYEDELVLGFLPLPSGRLTDGHVLIVPKRHVVDLFEAAEADLYAVISGVRRVSKALRAALGASGVNVLNASGPDSEQSVFHLHFHVVPRWSGDGLRTWPTGTSQYRVQLDPGARIRSYFADAGANQERRR